MVWFDGCTAVMIRLLCRGLFDGVRMTLFPQRLGRMSIGRSGTFNMHTFMCISFLALEHSDGRFGWKRTPQSRER